MTASVHLALFMPDLSGGGAERVMLNLAHGFLERGIRTDLVLVNASGAYLDQVDPRITVHDLGASRAITSISPLVHYLRHQQPSALISALGQTNLAAIMASRLSTTRVKVLVTEHQSFEQAQEVGFRRSVFPFLARRLYRHATVVAVSQGVADTMSSVLGLPRDRIHVIANPVLTDELPARAAEGLPAGSPERYLIAVGRLTALKNFPLLLRAFGKVVPERPDLHLVILGEGSARAELEDLTSQLGLTGRVHLPGFMANPYPWIRSSLGLIMSSDSEGLPTVLIEGLALNVPLVSTDCVSGPREILEGGRLGRLVPVGDATALAEAMLAASQDSGNPATEHDLDKYRVQTAAGNYLRALGIEP